ncbi:MAG TPA: helix-turn-helix domain-containing protein [Chitinophagales bacterium]|nr:helix-turn-helix domain-containing protein [Chitinophagales bacterium]
MSRANYNASRENIPYLTDLVSFYEHVRVRPPLHKDFDIREINPEVLKGYDYVAKPFRHSFYCIDLLLDGDVTLNTGFWKSKLSKPALYFKTPCQVLSWMKPERWMKEYFIVFTEDFMLRYKALADIIFDLPFFQMDKAIPFEIEPEEVELLAGLYKEILREYRSDNADKFDLISSYTHALLIHVRRLYYKYAESDSQLSLHIKQSEHSLVDRFRALIRKHIMSVDADNKTRTVKFFASELSTHPNHLNAVVKRQTKKTAIALIHEQLIHEAKSLLSQTPMSIKEVAFNLGFSEPSHFNHFFKKQTHLTPALYRKEKQLSFSHNSF